MKITEADVTLNCQAKTRDDALNLAATELLRRGLVHSNFPEALLAREKELSTWIGSGVAMPHINRRDSHLIRSSGFHILQFPEGVKWDKGHITFLVVAVAATDNKHLEILSGLANLLDDERLVQRLSLTSSLEIFVSLMQ